jgi:hypothetical protein
MSRKRGERLAFALGIGVLGLTIAYGAAAVVVFDLTEPAYYNGVEAYQGRPAAAGPRPRIWFCQPAYHYFYYDGSEWPFTVFAPVCAAWRGFFGYVEVPELKHPER